MRIRPLAKIVIFALFAGFTCLPVIAQTSESEISARLVGKPLYLHGCWRDDKLKFDAAGQASGHYAVASFTLAGIEVSRVELRGDRLRIEGRRVGVMFESSGAPIRIPMTKGTPGKDASPEKVTVEIDGHGKKDFGPALDAIFSEGLAGMVPDMPAYWQRYAKLYFLTPIAAGGGRQPLQPKNVAEPGAMHIGGGVRPPRVSNRIDPEFGEDARRMKISGNVMVYLWVDEQGMPGHISVGRPIGMGLDEQAVRAVSLYRFSPAMHNGSPVAVDLYIDVNFQIF